MTLRLTAIALVVAGLGLSAAAGPAVPETDSAAVHVLNRLAYGPRPGDVAQVRAMGVAAWIERQLHPERIEDGALQARLAPLDTLGLSSRRIVQDYDRPALEERRRRQREAAKESAGAPNVDEPQPDREPPTEAQRKNRQVLQDLTDAKLLRAVYSERQLETVLTDFWFNHFNVFAGKGPTRDYVTEYERDVIRPRVFGRFRDLLGAVAKSPAMLFYLDNWENVDPHAADRAAALRTARALRSRRGFAATTPPQQQARPRGLNENYARELLELHTLGVDGGYTQADIVAVARAFTGWTMQPRQGSGFIFAAALHDPGPKTVLGHTLPPNAGVADGERVLDLVAEHPSTARFIAMKLARRFVSDTPPPALVDRAAARFRETHGDLREVVRTIVTAPEFFAADVIGAKLKTPLEFTASALRATGAEITDARPLAKTLRDLGMPSYLCQPPTGYADTAEAWASPGMLVSRVNFALALAQGRVRGVRVSTVASDASTSAPLADPAFQHH